MQIQDRFEDMPLEALGRAGLGVYELIPDYRERCPSCRGRACAVRHGLYRRVVVDRGGAVYPDFPVPRFRCRARGPGTPRAVTFSVLPAALVARRRLSLPVMVWALDLLLRANRSLREVLDAFAEALRGSSRPWFPDPPLIYRILHLFAEAERRVSLLDDPAAAAEASSPGPAGEGRLRARARRVLLAIGAPARAAPLAHRFHRLHFPAMLFGHPKATAKVR